MLEITVYKSYENFVPMTTLKLSFEIVYLDPKYELLITEFWARTLLTNTTANCPAA